MFHKKNQRRSNEKRLGNRGSGNFSHKKSTGYRGKQGDWKNPRGDFGNSPNHKPDRSSPFRRGQPHRESIEKLDDNFGNSWDYQPQDSSSYKPKERWSYRGQDDRKKWGKKIQTKKFFNKSDKLRNPKQAHEWDGFSENRHPHRYRKNRDEFYQGRPHREKEEKESLVPDKPYLIIGIRPLEEAIRRGVKFHRLYLQKPGSERFEYLIDYAKEHKINFFFVDKAELDKKSDHGNHQGVAAELKRDTRLVPDLQEYLEKNPMNGEAVLILDQITDQQNVGAIARSAYFFGCRLIISEKHHSAPIDTVVHKTSSGASLMVAFHLADKVAAAVETLKEFGFEILAAASQSLADLEGGFNKKSGGDEEQSLSPQLTSQVDEVTEVKDLKSVYTQETGEPKKKIAVILGSEGKGIRPHLERLADRKITIPRLNSFDSLNVSVATGIILYALSEARLIGDGEIANQTESGPSALEVAVPGLVIAEKKKPEKESEEEIKEDTPDQGYNDTDSPELKQGKAAPVKRAAVKKATVKKTTVKTEDAEKTKAKTKKSKKTDT